MTRPFGFGLIETMRARNGRLPLLERHLARLRASMAALGFGSVRDDLAALARAAVAAAEGEGEGEGEGERVVRLEVRDDRATVTTRDLPSTRPLAVIVAAEPHEPYPHKSTARDQFDEALEEALTAGADDALLVTRTGHVAEGTAWSVCWWDRDVLCTPAADLGILPGVGRAHLGELAPLQEVRVPLGRLAGRSLFLVNAVRGIVEIAECEGERVPQDGRTAELSQRFWPD